MPFHHLAVFNCILANWSKIWHMVTVLIRYAEIALKGANRSVFENQLIKNIKLSQKLPLQIIKLQKQILISGAKIDLNKLKQVFGIAWFAPVTVVPNNQPSITAAALKLTRSKLTFAVRAHHNLEVALGDIIRLKKKIKVDLSHPQQTIYVAQTDKEACLPARQALIYNQKISGPGGLPVGTSGKLLCLLSGGFDSIAAAYMLAKRGARVDFLHFHVFPNADQVLKSKIKTITDHLKTITLSRQLFLASYAPFQIQILDLSPDLVKQELVVYRRLMVRVGEILAQKYGYQALILGDSLGQVASQTLENIVAVDEAVKIPLFRPLIGTDKKDIIDLVRQIGLEAVTNQPYKDCCSLITTHPSTIANMNKIAALEKRIKINAIIKEITDNVQIINL